MNLLYAGDPMYKALQGNYGAGSIAAPLSGAESGSLSQTGSTLLSLSFSIFYLLPRVI